MWSPPPAQAAAPPQLQAPGWAAGAPRGDGQQVRRWPVGLAGQTPGKWSGLPPPWNGRVGAPPLPAHPTPHRTTHTHTHAGGNTASLDCPRPASTSAPLAPGPRIQAAGRQPAPACRASRAACPGGLCQQGTLALTRPLQALGHHLGIGDVCCVAAAQRLDDHLAHPAGMVAPATQR